MFDRKIEHEVDCTHLVSKSPQIVFIETLVDMDNDLATLYIQWDAIEIIQDAMPYLEWGWDGFVPIGIYRGGGELDI